jgi:ankyrin repeat protein
MFFCFFVSYINNKRMNHPKINFDIDISVLNEYAFRYACVNGHLHDAQWLLQNKPAIDISAYNEEVFRYACSNGHLHVAQWLLQIKPTIDISANNESAFIWACVNGHLHVSKWLVSLRPDKYKITLNVNGTISYDIMNPLNIVGAKEVSYSN